MSKPIAYATTALMDELRYLMGLKYAFTTHQVELMAMRTIRCFLMDAKAEGRFDIGTIEQLIGDLE